jgi:DhnA family fructose-bisphosphate aldolase class Ia
MTALDAVSWSRLRDARAQRPDGFAARLRDRPRRDLLRGDGRLLIVAADHPARGALGIRTQPLAMGDRYDLLQRLACALEQPGVDGVLGSADILEDLANLGLLDDRIAVGTMNRGGLRGASFELDDRPTGYGVADLVAGGADMGKLLLRIGLADPATVRVLEWAGLVVSDAARARVPLMIEPFMSDRIAGAIVNDLTTDAVITSVAIAAGLGGSSAYSWLKLPVVPDMERVMAATTLPTLLLGGDPPGGAEESFGVWEAALALEGVRGLVVGRTLLYPPDDDVAGAVGAAARLVHGPDRAEDLEGVAR